jgi:uncharacterized membrane protein
MNKRKEVKEMKKIAKNIFTLLCIGILCAVAIPVIVGIVGNEDFLTVDAITRTTALGNNASYQVTIENIGDETDTFSLTAINMDNASIAVLSQTEILLDPGQSGNVVLNVTDDLVAGPYYVLVNATSQTIGLTGEVETTTAVVEEEEE